MSNAINPNHNDPQVKVYPGFVENSIDSPGPKTYDSGMNRKANSIFDEQPKCIPEEKNVDVPAEEKTLSEEEVMLEAFKAYDKNKDLYVTEEEFINHILSEYMANGKQLPKGVDNISDYITMITDKFRRNAGSDGRANIDEFKNMYAPEAHSTETEHTDVYPL